jgi:hypothetical protein
LALAPFGLAPAVEQPLEFRLTADERGQAGCPPGFETARRGALAKHLPHPNPRRETLQPALAEVDPGSFAPEARAYFFDADGKPWPAGHQLINAALADTLATIARDGPNAFYKGDIAGDIARAVQTDSRAHLARNWAFDRAIKCGRGFYRIETDYVNDLTFDQKIVYKRVKNQFCVYFDPFCQEPDFSDAQWCFITQDLPWKEYQRTFKESSLAKCDDGQLTAIGNDLPGWISETDEGRTVRLAEYYYFDLKKDTLVAIQTDQGPKTILKSVLGEAYSDDIVIKGRDGKPMARQVEKRQLCWAKMNAVEFLDEEERDGQYIPVVPVIGDESNINGDTRYTGIVRPAIHAQRLFNVEASSLAEAVHLGPIAPFIGYAEQFEGYESWWGQLNTRRFPYLPVNPARDPSSGVLPLPQRNTAEQPIQAIMVSLQQARSYVHDTTGIPPVALGQIDPSNHSGKAILALQKQSELGTSGYLDNLAALSLVLEGKILRDLIPIIYGQKGRLVAAQGEDDERRMIPVGIPFTQGKNGQPQAAQPGQPNTKTIDLEKGQYSVTVTVDSQNSVAESDETNNTAVVERTALEPTEK